MKLTIDHGNGPVDYTQYVKAGTIQIQDAINVPTLTTFVLVNTDAAFVAPSRGDYFRLFSELDGKVLATGFVTNDPMRQLLGVSSRAAGGPRSTGFQMYEHTVKCTSDEWLANVHTIPYLPAFINQTQGQILSRLADALVPGFFDVTGVASGDVIPFYQYSSERTWSDVAKEFGDSVRYRYKVIDKAITFQPFGDDLLGITYDETSTERSFDPYALQADIVTVPPVNDATVLGSVEPHVNWDSFFVGDGFTGNFPLNHAAFEGSTSVVLQEDWTETDFNAAQNNVWEFFDPGLNFNVGAGALNVVGGQGVGTSYILAHNGVELGGALFLQHGEIEWNDTSTGLVGGVYDGVDFSQAHCVAGFKITPGTVVPSASGASGIIMQPLLLGNPVGPTWISQQNHHYILQTIIHGRRWDRYDRLFKGIQGTTYGGTQQAALGDITFVVLDVDMGVLVYNPLIPITYLPNPSVVMRYTATGQVIPSFGQYAPINSDNLNMTMWYTLLAFPPQAKLMVRSLSGASGGQLPILPSKLGSELGYTVGSGFQLQTATLGLLGDVDQLQFYNDQLPAVGARIRCQTWSAQQAAARVRNSAYIAAEGRIAGDDGVRSAIMTDLKPLPRTSEECELAAQAAIIDRYTPQYQGAYTVLDDFWNSAGDYPVSGRYLYMNSPTRNVNAYQLVSQVTTTVIELRQEKLQFQVAFGPDQYLEKLLAKFLERTESLLLPTSQSTQLTPLEVSQVGTFYGANLDDARILDVTGSTVLIDVGASPVTGTEVRRVDAGWGTPDQNFIGVFPNQQFTLPRVQRKQQWFLRQKNGSTYSRYSKGIYVDCPLTPAEPVLAKEDLLDWQYPAFTFDYGSGDIRDVYGIEVRDSDNVTVLYQKVIASPADLVFVLNNSTAHAKTGTLYVYFFNLMWEYSAPLVHTWNPTLLEKLMSASHTSYRPLSNPLTAHDAGSSATINIASFQMRTPVQTPVVDITLNSGSITGLAYNTLYFIFYDDPLFNGGAVTYQFSTSKETAISGEYRFFVGSIKTPVQGGNDTIGNNDGGTGAQSGQLVKYFFPLEFQTNGAPAFGNSSPSAAYKAHDGDTSTKTTGSHAGGVLIVSGVNLYGLPPLKLAWKSLTLYVRTAVPTNTLNGLGRSPGAAFCQYALDSTDPALGTQVTIWSVAAGVTRALQVDAVPLPLDQNLGTLTCLVSYFVDTTDGAGTSISVDFYEAWVEGVV